MIRLILIGLILSGIAPDCAKKLRSTSGTLQESPTAEVFQFETTPTWRDEFDVAGAPDTSKWSYDTGGSGWGNNEAQFYTTALRNAKVEAGKLVITAIKETVHTKSYTSARLVTKGKGDFLYGRVDVRAKLPKGRGTWPAIWMLPTDWAYGDWPASGEIDIMEHVGYDPNNVLFSIHTQAHNHSIGTEKSGGQAIATAMTEFHNYRVDWTPQSIRGYFDDKQVFGFANEGKGFASWPFDKRFHVILNLAIGGNWGGQQGIDDSIFPATYEVDYVRMYKLVQ